MSRQTVYAIASGKGGVGKTTTTVNLGTALAGMGANVAIVDVDLGMANLAGFISLDADSTTLHDVLAGRASVEEATYRLASRMDAIPGGADLASFADASPDALEDVVDDLRDRYDVVVLDLGAGVHHETVLPLRLADFVFVVTTPEPAAIQDAEKTIDLTDRAGGRVAGVIVTRTRSEGDVPPKEISNQLGIPLAAVVPEDDAVRDSIYAGTPLVVHDSKSPAARAYLALARRLTESGRADGAGPDVDRASTRPSRGDGAGAGSGRRRGTADGGSTDDTGDGDGAPTASHDDVTSAISDLETGEE